jgi:signal transduction histidine kinase
MGLDGGMYMARTGIETGDPDRLLDGWKILEENVERITSFVQEFLEFSKGKAPQVHITDPNSPARQVFELFQHTAQLAGVELTLHLDENIAPAQMDAEGVHTCLANLISNALDACSTSERDRGHVSLATRERNGTIIYEVSDDGEGMEYEVKKKVFTNFFSTKGSGKGTGLGLLTTRKIVQEHGGRVSFHSDRGHGSTFRLEFPRNRLPEPSRGEDTQERNKEATP